MREKMVKILARPGAGNPEVFGSAAREEPRPDREVDLLLDIVGQTPPWFPGGLAVELEGLLGTPVQIVIRDRLVRFEIRQSLSRTYSAVLAANPLWRRPSSTCSGE
jgi:predicted nucleotidyltransferase